MLCTSEGQEGSAVRSYQPGSEPQLTAAFESALGLEGVDPEALAELAERHNLFVHDPETGLLVHDAGGVTVAANAAAERLLGLSSQEMVGRVVGDPRWAAVLPSGSALPAEEHPVARALSSGESVRNAIIGVHRPTDDGEGEYVWLEVGSVPLSAAGSTQPDGVVSSLRDVTHLVRSDLALRESEARYRLLADNSSDVITRTTLRGVITWISPSVRHLLGYSPQCLVGAPTAYLVHPDDVPMAIRAYRALAHASPDDVRTLSLRLRRRGGAYVDVEVALHAVVGPDGTVAEIQSSTRDVSARVAAERARRSAEDVFRLAMEHAPMGMAVLGLDGQWVTFNSALPRLTGHDASAFARLSMLDLVHHDHRPAVTAALRQMLDAEIETSEQNLRLLTDSGAEVWAELSTRLIRDDDGTP